MFSRNDLKSCVRIAAMEESSRIAAAMSAKFPDRERMAAALDSTLLKAWMAKKDVEALCESAARNGCAAVCVPSGWVADCRGFLKGSGPSVCTVVGFPLGAVPTDVKLMETRIALEDGATEIDAVLQVGWLKMGRYDAVLDELKAIRRAAMDATLKVIVETPLLTNEEMVAAAKIVGESGADYIKTCTGFAGEASLHAVYLLRFASPSGVRLKASGGIKTVEMASACLALGAERLGTSAAEALVLASPVRGAEGPAR